MNTPSNLASWIDPVASLALQTVFLVAVTSAAAFFVRSAQWRRLFWQICLIALVALTVAEMTGIGRGLTDWTASRVSLDRAATVDSPTNDLVTTVSVRTFEAPEFESSATNGNPPANASIVLWPLFIWLSGTALLLARVAFATFLCAKIARRNRPAAASIIHEIESLKKLLGLARPIRVLDSSALTAPIVFGFLNPSLVIPANFEREFDPAQRRAILAHELAHLANRDPAWQRLANVTVALLWWNPLAWWARRQFSISSEQCADQASAILPNGPEALAESLVKLAARLHHPRAFAALSIHGGGFRSGLGKRVARLLSEKPTEWKAIGWCRQLATGFLGGTVLIMLVFTGTFFARAKATASEIKSLPDALRSSWLQSPAALALTDLPDDPRTDASALTESNPPAATPEIDADEPAPSSPQITVEAKFVEAPPSFLDLLLASGDDWQIVEVNRELTDEFGEPPSNDAPNAATHQLSGRLTAASYQSLVAHLMKLPGADILSAPRVTTSPGLRAQMTVGQRIDGNHVGVRLDLIPNISANAETILLTSTVSATERLDPAADNEVDSAKLRVRQAKLHDFAIVPGETMVLRAFSVKTENPVKDLFIFLTPTFAKPSAATPGEIVPAVLIKP